jgi:hypothetical protein
MVKKKLICFIKSALYGRKNNKVCQSMCFFKLDSIDTTYPKFLIEWQWLPSNNNDRKSKLRAPGSPFKKGEKFKQVYLEKVLLNAFFKHYLYI